ncbi:hypothetical protein [Pseudonocardia sp. H11422]|uniref:hypothetical protein n=1 Tax=Pseudonocardia sp. H11422 TaxID=2835866 RepID=UPI001BDD0545|nr:hypothetical protein [Pseudonocardia sp. H11422]
MRRTARQLAALSVLTSASASLAAGTASAQDAQVDEPSTFTSLFTANGTPDMVADNDGVPAPGEPETRGTFNHRVNSDEEIIC